VILLLIYMYGLKHAGRVWNRHLNKGLTELGCKHKLEKAVTELANKIKIKDESGMDEYLGIKIERQNEGDFKHSQPLLIEEILETMGFNSQNKPKDTPHCQEKFSTETWMGQIITPHGTTGEINLT